MDAEPCNFLDKRAREEWYRYKRSTKRQADAY